jgi:hypothetical protein
VARLLVHVEGQTEEQFVNELLAPHLYASGYVRVSARMIGNARQRQRRGGIVPWRIVRKEITNHLKEDGEIFATSMVDYYGLPRAGPGAWPGREAASALPYPDNVRDAFPNPEQIDDSPHNAPSKRIVALIPEYEKPFMGVLASLQIGLEAMRSECPHFSAWLERLEAVVG